MKKNLLRTLAIILCLAMFSPSFVPNLGLETVQAATKIKLSKTKIEIPQGEVYKLSLNGATSKSVKWQSNNKKIATVSSKGTVTGVLAGTTTITAKYKGKTYKCKVTVKKFGKEYVDTESFEVSYLDTDFGTYSIVKYTNNSDYDLQLNVLKKQYDTDGFFISSNSIYINCEKGKSAYLSTESSFKTKKYVLEIKDVVLIEKTDNKIEAEYELQNDGGKQTKLFSIIFNNASKDDVRTKCFVIFYDENDVVVDSLFYGSLYLPSGEKVKKEERVNISAQRAEIVFE